jgi:hypothetical protein
MNAKMLFEHLTPARERAEAFPRRQAFAVIAAQIRQRLFAFENRGYGLLTQSRAIGGDVGAITALG